MFFDSSTILRTLKNIDVVLAEYAFIEAKLIAFDIF